MPKQILLADDSITIQKVISLTFAGEDYKITAVDNGVDAIAKARELKPDIILVDVIMPQKNGYEVSAIVKNDPVLKDIPVLLLAGTFEPFDEEEAKRAGADGYIVKPFESQALLQKVKDMIGRGAARPAVPSAPPSSAATPPAAPSGIIVQPPKVAPSPTVTPPVPVEMPTTRPVQPPVPEKVAISQPSPAATPKVQPLSSPPSAPTAPAKEEDFWSTMMEEVEEKAPESEAVPVQEAVEEVAGEEVWDIGEFEEEKGEVAPKEEEIWEAFAFEEEEKEKPAPAAAVEEFTDEEFFLAPEEITETDEFAEIELEDEHVGVDEGTEIIETAHAGEEFAFIEEEPVAKQVQEEILEGYEQTFEPGEIETETLAGSAPEAETPQAIPSQSAQLPLTEEQLRSALRQLSRDVIEKIVWEVVPDLAEMLIKEEIKRLQKK